jgi:hypothetical protein
MHLLPLELGGDEDVTPMDTTIDYKVRSFLYLHSNFGYNSLGSTCTCPRNKLTSKICQGAASPSFGPFGLCNVSRLLSDVSRDPCMPLRLYNQ